MESGVIGFLLGTILMYFIRPYLAKKAENLATIEDIGTITKKIEEVRSDYAKQILELSHQNTLLVESLRTESSLRLAAAEKRLDAHQQAFALWRKLLFAMDTPDQYKTVQECDLWWNNNCIYLSSIAREAFSSAYWAAHIHRAYRESNSASEVISENWGRIENAGQKIVEGAELPPLGEIESRRLPKENN